VDASKEVSDEERMLGKLTQEEIDRKKGETWVKIVNKKGNFSTLDQNNKEQEMRFKLVIEQQIKELPTRGMPKSASFRKL
jgi:hypothetical protein